MTKIFFLFPTRRKIEFKPKFGGGSEAYLHDLSTSLAERDLEIHVVANFVDKEHDLVKLHRVNFSGNILERNWEYFKTLHKLLDRGSIAIVFDQGFGGYVPVFLKHIRNFKLIFHTTNHYPWLETEINPRMYWPILKTVVRNADLVVVGNKLLANSVAIKSGIALSQIEIIPQAMRDDDPLRNVNIDVREKYGIGESPLILHVGRIVPHKRIADIIRAARIVSEEIPEAKFFLVGPRGDKFSADGRDVESKYYLEMIELRNSLSLDASVRFTGAVSREEIYSFFKAADVFVFASYKEGFGTAVLEAMSFGKPVVAYDNPPVNENISDAGILVKSGDFEKLAEAIIDILKDPVKARVLGRAALERFKSNYSLESVVDKWVNLLKNIQQ